MEFQDYYAVLGIPRTASEKELRAAYRRLARQHHPDVNPGDKAAEERFKQVNEAYEVLSDPEKRKRYDELGSRWREYEQWQRAREAAGRSADPSEWGGFAGQAPGGGARYEYRTVSEEDLRDLFGDEAPFSDFFETFFTSGGEAAAGARRRARTSRPPRPRAGDDLEHPLEVRLADAYRGTTVELSLRLPDGQTRRLEVKVPAGVRTGSRIRVAGQGGAGQAGGPGGDLYLVVDVSADPRFERRGDDLHTTVHAPLGTMLLGGEVRVPTPDGRMLALKVPATTPDGRVFRLRGQGMPRLGQPDRRGDLHAAVHVRLPERLTPRQRELVEQLVGEGEGAAAGAGAR